MVKTQLYRLLERPWVYSLSQAILLPGATQLLRRPYQRLFEGSSGWILDVGCGPSLTTPPPATGTVVGLDVNPEYVRTFAGPAEDSSVSAREGRFHGVVASATAVPFADERFDETRCMGIFHHLPDSAVRSAVAEMRRVTRPGGRIIIIDNVWPLRPSRRPIAWAVRRLDRGDWVRSQEALISLVRSAVAEPWKVERVTYTLSGLELLLMTCILPPARPVGAS